MSKKNIIISILIVLVVIILGILYYFSQTDNYIYKYSPTKSDYTVEEGLDNIAKAVVPALENYVIKIGSESNNSRNERLSLYFAGDSPVYEYELNNLKSSNPKNYAKATSVSYPISEGKDMSVNVKVNLVTYINDKPNSDTQNYWISVKETSDGSLIAYDVMRE